MLGTRLTDFIEENHPGESPDDQRERLAWLKNWSAALFDAGLAGPAWPTEWGGMGLDIEDQVRYFREMAEAELPIHASPNLGTIGPTLIVHGTDAQRERFLKPMLRADELWAQGYSEPDAGSDLPSLRTRAVLDGDAYLVNGTKVWSTMADRSDWVFALVRTGSQESGRKGISFLLIPLDAEGLTITPIRDMTGGAGFSEIVFEDVRVPTGNLVGEENKGWSIARTSLGHERSAASAARAHRYLEIVSDLIAMTQDRGRNDEPALRQELAHLYSQAKLLQVGSGRSLAKILKDGRPGPESSTSRLFHSQFEKRLHEVAVNVLGPEGLLAGRGSGAYEDGRWGWGMLRTRASTIGAGTAEIQRTTIADHVLGLPRK